MPPRKKVKLSDHFGVAICSLCEEIAVCFGEKKGHGAIRYCEGCFQNTLSWVQMNDKERAVLLGILRAYQKADSVKAQIAIMQSETTPELRHSIAIGESARRLAESDRGV